MKIYDNGLVFLSYVELRTAYNEELVEGKIEEMTFRDYIESFRPLFADTDGIYYFPEF